MQIWRKHVSDTKTAAPVRWPASNCTIATPLMLRCQHARPKAICGPCWPNFVHQRTHVACTMAPLVKFGSSGVSQSTLPTQRNNALQNPKPQTHVRYCVFCWRVVDDVRFIVEYTDYAKLSVVVMETGCKNQNQYVVVSGCSKRCPSSCGSSMDGWTGELPLRPACSELISATHA